MSENSGLKIVYHEDGSEIDIKEKYEYKEQLWPSKRNK
jgi:hypothetical protein